jgi:hypothetical protein
MFIHGGLTFSIQFEKWNKCEKKNNINNEKIKNMMGWNLGPYFLASINSLAPKQIKIY